MVRCDYCMKNPVHPDKKCCFNCARSGTDCEVWHNCGEDCPGWKSKVITNGDKIRAMTYAELEEFLREVYNTGSKSAEAWYCGEGHRHGFEWTEDWLKQPADDDC